MRPEFRATRSVRTVPTWQNSSESAVSKSNIKKAPSARPVSLPPTVSSHYISGAIELSWKKQVRHRMTDVQLLNLDALYERNTHPTTEEKQALGKQVGLYVVIAGIFF
jgi:hypothetical protein